MNSNFDSKFITVGVIDSNSASGVVVHRLHESHNPFLYGKFSHGPPDDFSWYAIERLFKVNKCEVQCFSCNCLSMNIASVVPRPGMKPNVIDRDSFPDDFFYHSLHSFHVMIKEFETSVVTSPEHHLSLCKC